MAHEYGNEEEVLRDAKGIYNDYLRLLKRVENCGISNYGEFESFKSSINRKTHPIFEYITNYHIDLLMLDRKNLYGRDAALADIYKTLREIDTNILEAMDRCQCHVCKDKSAVRTARDRLNNSKNLIESGIMHWGRDFDKPIRFR